LGLVSVKGKLIAFACGATIANIISKANDRITTAAFLTLPSHPLLSTIPKGTQVPFFCCLAYMACGTILY
jgi:hypothetical protein